MQVRQSPKAKVSPDKNDANWPPKSPYEALLSSPGGRKRWQDHRDRVSASGDRSVSPSPRRPLPTTSRALQALADVDMSDTDTDADADDDEETLQLQLQAIQAKLKLKKLQKQKSMSAELASSSQTDPSQSPRKRQKTHRAALDPAIQIAVSPIKDRMPPPPPPPLPPSHPQNTSPARVLLGIDKGLKAGDVSLKRARNGSALSRKLPAASSSSSLSSSSSQAGAPKQSFSERIAASRLSTEQQLVKHNRIESSRSAGFGLAKLDNNSSNSNNSSNGSNSNNSRPDLPTSNIFSRSTPISAASHSPFLNQRPSTSNGPATPASQPSSSTKPRSFRPADKFSYDASTETASTEPAPDGSSFESFSSLHLSRRKMPHTTLARALDAKEIYTLPRLLKEVKAPVYEPPDCESDFVVLAVLASKSSPYDTRPKHHQTSSTADDSELCGRNKFMVMKLTDLKWEVDLFLFDTAFEAFWKLTPGTVVAILNPTIMPPKTNKDSGRFSLKLASSEDSVVEVGAARDLGFCTSLKKNGQECGSWVNARKTKFCDYHVELAVSKTRASRMEVNTMYLPNKKHINSRSMGEAEWARRNDPLKRDGDSGERYFMIPGARSAASLLDSEDFAKQDTMRKRLKEREKDRQLAEKLGRMGNGMGAEYLRTTTGTTTAPATAPSQTAADADADDLAPPPKLSAADLGLLGRKASDVRLSPVRKKLFSLLPGGRKTTAAGPEAMGWGGAGKRGLDDRKRGRGPEPVEEGQQTLRVHRHTGSGNVAAAAAGAEDTPKKKARFMLERKGLRMPGRDSLGDVPEGSDNDDDDLEII